MDNYILAKSFNKANIQNRLWYTMSESDLDTLKIDKKIQFGDRAYAINEKTLHIMGNDDTWYDASDSGGNIALDSLNATDNGTYIPTSGHAYSSVVVAIPTASGVSY